MTIKRTTLIIVYPILRKKAIALVKKTLELSDEVLDGLSEAIEKRRVVLNISLT